MGKVMGSLRYRTTWIKLAVSLLYCAGLISTTSAAAATDWSFKIQASIGGINSRLTLGEFANASVGYDILYDAPAYPNSAAVSAFFPHSEWGRAETQYWYDIQSIGRSRQWTFFVDSTQQNQNLTLSWDTALIPSAVTLTLTDVLTGQTVNMSSLTSYTFLYSATREFRVTADTPLPPVLTVTSPGDSAVVSSPSLTITGTATDAGQGDDGVATVTVNGSPAVGGTATGAAIASWSYDALLSQGTNTFTIVATDNGIYKDQVIKMITVTYVPTNVDSDNDGLPDAWELQHFGNLTTADASTDSDGDGLTDAMEYSLGTDPKLSDTDGDGLSDLQEITYHTNPLLADSDGDGDSDGDEVKYGSDPTNSADNLNSHRPNAPVVAPVSGSVALDGTVFDALGFNDPDIVNGDYLAASQWQISTTSTFDANAIILDRMLQRRSGASSADMSHRKLAVEYGVLHPSVTYWIRTRHQDKTGLWSAWSSGLNFTTVTVDPEDVDNNGVNDRVQLVGFSDTNNNGIDDRNEPNLKAVNSAVKNMPVGIEISQGTVNSVTAVNNATASTIDMPYGVFGFRVEGLPVNAANPATVTVTFHFPESLPNGVHWYKYDLANDKFTDLSAKAVFNGNQVVVTLTDGGPEDADGLVNGVIIDPAGPAIVTSSVSGTSSGGGGAGGPVEWCLLPGVAFVWRRWRRR